MRWNNILFGIALTAIGHLIGMSERVDGYEIAVHEALSNATYDVSILKTTDFLQEIGVGSNLNGKNIKTCVADGSKFEDGDPIGSISPRPLNHFYDPVTGQGLLGIFLPDFVATDAINWGLKIQPCGALNLDCGTRTQEWSIPDARNYLYKGLTDPDPKVREGNLAKTFRAIGQVIHLIQDMAQPQHVRDDPHLSVSENPNNPLNWDRSRYEAYTLAQAPNLITGGYPQVILNDYRLFWAGGGKGLADFTNANFVSEDTNFTSLAQGATDGKHPSPTLDLDDFEIADLQTLDPGRKDVDGDLLEGNLLFFGNTYHDLYTDQTGHNQRMTASSIFDGDLTKAGKFPIFSLNEFNFQAQSEILIPRAVGYSAGLIDYFFRGRLEVQRVPGGIKVKNASTETMSAYLDSTTQQTVGKISVYYDTPFDPNHPENPDRHLLATLDLIAPLDHLDPGQEAVIPFAPPADNVAPGRYIVVFQGKLGAEEGAVAGRVSQEHIYHVAENGDGLRQIFRMNGDGGDRVLIYDNLTTALHIARLSVAPDGKSLVFGAGATRAASSLYLLDLASSPDIPATPLTQGDSPSFAPDGNKIVFERTIGQNDVELFVIDLQTRIETQLTAISGPSISQHPSWSPDGNRIAYSRSNGNPTPDCANFYVIALVSPSGQDLGPVSCKEAGYNDFSPAWSPGGEALVFMRSEPSPEAQTYQIYRVNAGGAQIKLTDAPVEGEPGSYSEEWPVWSPDGAHIAVGSDRDGDPDIWLVDPNGGGYLTNLTGDDSGIDQFPVYGR